MFIVFCTIDPTSYLETINKFTKRRAQADIVLCLLFWSFEPVLSFLFSERLFFVRLPPFLKAELSGKGEFTKRYQKRDASFDAIWAFENTSILTD